MAITRIGGANAISGTIPTSVGGTGSTAATLPASLINNTSIGNVTALPASITTGKIVKAAYAVNTSEVTTSGGAVITSLSFTPTNSSNKVLLFANCGQIRKATAGTGSAAAIKIFIDSDGTNARSENEGYPESESDTRGNITCLGYHDCWSGGKTVSVKSSGFGSGISYSYQSAPTTLIVLEVEV
tara:strand:+ start:20 stop:574 length:555 start_codon:yes stop_codon:yes gene_type:complete